MEDPVVNVERSKGDLLMIKDLNRDSEYRPCDRNDESGIYVDNYDYYFVRRDNDICAFVEEIVTPKYWDHDYISPKLYIRSLQRAAEKHRKVGELIGASEEPEAMRIMYSVVTCERYEGKESVGNVIKAIDAIIDEIRREADIISKRELLKFINKE
ncbi:hypothetical protein P8918_13170 [Bacillus spizizenii]|nr:hypothetical protein [Bacillus spizizenii]MCY8890522.1 hypothetical protein [Bacillus spizizenii]MEC0841977.1 hypothetical protein [Bacillus spizizenii]